MKATKGKRLTDLTITLRVVVLPIAGYAFKDKAVEKWCIYRLTSDDQATRVMAAEKLATMGSLRAVWHLQPLQQRRQYRRPRR